MHHAAHSVPARTPAVPRLKRERYTGRNDQLNLKVTTETRSRFIELCNANPSMTQGELMERLIDSYQQA